jgi:hypothetical protein
MLCCCGAVVDIQVDLRRVPSIATWRREFTLENVLVELRKYVL